MKTFKEFEAALEREVKQAVQDGWAIQHTAISRLCCCPLGALTMLRGIRDVSFPQSYTAAMAWGISTSEANSFIHGFEWLSLESEDDNSYVKLGRKYRLMYGTVTGPR